MLMKQAILLTLTLGSLVAADVNYESHNWEDWVHCDDGLASTIPPKTVYTLSYKHHPVAYVYNNCDGIVGFNNDQYCQMKKGLASVDGFTVAASCLVATSMPERGSCRLNCNGGVCICTNK